MDPIRYYLVSRWLDFLRDYSINELNNVNDQVIERSLVVPTPAAEQPFPL